MFCSEWKAGSIAETTPASFRTLFQLSNGSGLGKSCKTSTMVIQSNFFSHVLSINSPLHRTNSTFEMFSFFFNLIFFGFRNGCFLYINSINHCIRKMFCYVEDQHASYTSKIQNIANTICNIKVWIKGIQEKFEDTKGVIRTCTSKDRQKDNIAEFVNRLT